MGNSRVQSGRAEEKKGEPPLIPDDLHNWIDRVVVPILVQEFIRAKSLQKEANDG
jgi:hypothetical protein